VVASRAHDPGPAPALPRRLRGAAALLLGALVAEGLERGRFAALRFHLAVAFTLGIHMLGLLLLLGSWATGLFAGRATERQLLVRSEVWWVTATWRALARIYGIRLVIDGEGALERGPIVLMSRHASLLDTILPILIASSRHGLALRYVAKRELLWDPCVDLVGHRLATAFVRRNRRDHDLDVAVVESLARDLGPRDAIVIFPEGTRFTEAKRTRTLAALAGRDDVAFAHASRLKNLLPPHPGGPLHLLDVDGKRMPFPAVVYAAVEPLGVTRLLSP
jgi:1-acyl-sn-glycerol-3-phosphate acyltransferase